MPSVGCNLQRTFLFAIIFSASVSLYLSFLSSSPLALSLDVSNIKRQYLDEFKQQNQQQQEPSTPVNYHVIFSTGCSLQQNWESYVFYYHAFRVGQPGNVTRLASGCLPDEESKLRQFHQDSIATMSERFHLHFTPDYSKWEGNDVNYKYANKPNSIYHWMVNVLHMDQKNYSKFYEDDIIILMDPDMVLLRPLLHDFTRKKAIFVSKKNKRTTVVRHGFPIAQQDGYLTDEWQRFNVSHITQGGKFPDFKQYDGPTYWNSGPPYLATVKDMWNMVKLWKDYLPRLYQEYPKLFAEMYSLVIAKTQLNLPFTLVKSIVVSDVDMINRKNRMMSEREGWELIDQIPQDLVCTRAVNAVTSTQPKDFDLDLPNVLHYCQRYFIGRFFFSKYRLKKKYISCEAPILTRPPHDIAETTNYAARPPPDKGRIHEMEVYNLTESEAKRQAFMVCGLISAVDEAAIYYKKHNCNKEGTIGNFSETYNFFDDPHSL